MRTFLILVLIALNLSPEARTQERIIVTSVANDGAGSLREAILKANKAETRTFIIFSDAIGHEVTLTSDLPDIENAMEIRGQRNSSPQTALHFTASDYITNGLNVSADDVTISGLHIYGYRDSGIVIDEADNVRVLDSIVGGDNYSGSLQLGNGITIRRSANALIAGNEISGNRGNGIAVTGTAALPDNVAASDFFLRSKEDVIASYDIREKIIATVPMGNHTFIKNAIGVIFDEGWKSGNKGGGISIDHSSGNQIGGGWEDGNLVSNNGIYGIKISGQYSEGNVIQGNRIGTDRHGVTARPNRRAGILIFNSGRNLIGGELGSTGNLISGNGRHGINIDGSATRPALTSALGGCGFSRENEVSGNLIGTDLLGEEPLPNGKHGVLIFVAGNNQVGGDAGHQRNIISANKENGVLIIGANLKSLDWRDYVRIPDSREELKTNIRCVGPQHSTAVAKNRIIGNTIGLSKSLSGFLPNGKNAVTIRHAHDNEIVKNEIAPSSRSISIAGRTAVNNVISLNSERER